MQLYVSTDLEIFDNEIDEGKILWLGRIDTKGRSFLKPFMKLGPLWMDWIVKQAQRLEERVRLGLANQKTLDDVVARITRIIELQREGSAACTGA